MEKQQAINELSELQIGLPPIQKSAMASVIAFVDSTDERRIRDQIKFCKHFIEYAETAIELINLK